ncbi:MAG: hypothetical protein JWR07_1867 [Nevskia sp.]|nr:hypothetical protein [Nevskia sp.]
MKGLKGSKLPVRRCAALLATGMALLGGSAHAGILDFYNDGKVLATPGVSMTDGAGGGGITPWAVITGYETRDGINADFHYTYVNLPNYSLNSLGAAVGFYDRVELSYAYDILPTGSTFNTIGLVSNAVGGLLSSPTLGPILSGLGLTTGNQLAGGVDPWNTTIKMHVVGAKVRLIGEAIYDSDNLIPQVSVGGFYKWNENKVLLETLQAAKSKDWEAYASITKIFFPVSTLLNVTARYTGANQTGLTGFGGPDGDHKKVRVEASLAYLLKKDTAIGVEFQQHGHNVDGRNVTLGGGLDLTSLVNNPLLGPTLKGLGVDSALVSTLTQKESNWYDAFVAFFPSKNLSITMAMAYLGQITFTPNQVGYYISLQTSF